jgi:membrane-bound lytic murein transglycosylase D
MNYTSLLALLIFSACANVKMKRDRHEWFKQVKKDHKGTHQSKAKEYTDNELEKLTSAEPITKSTSTQIADLLPKHKVFLRDINDEQVNFWINYFSTKDKARFQRFINNGEQYRAVIEDILRQNGLPHELYYVGLIESGYYLGAKSHAKAVGPWQFIAGTGKAYGLMINAHVDERRDLEKATQAAAFYFKDLYNIFGSWELALCAYNAGENGIIRRIRKGNTRDFYQLADQRLLPKETRNYIPKVRAAMYVMQNYQRYGFTKPQVNYPFEHTEDVILKKQYSLKQLASSLNLQVDQIKKLNPDLIGYYTPYTKKGYRIRFPNSINPSVAQNKIEKIKTVAKIKNSKQVKSTNFVYQVKAGDNLSHIANIFNLNFNQIKNANKMKSSKIFVGQKLVIPGWKKTKYTVKKGDNLIAISKKFKTQKNIIATVNGLKNYTIYPGQKLIVGHQI